MRVRGPTHRLEVGDLTLVAAVQFHRPQVRDQPCSVEATPNDSLTVRREERPAVVAVGARQTANGAPVRGHDVDLRKEGRVQFELLDLLGRRLALEDRTVRGERDPFAVGAVARFGVVTPRSGQPLELTGGVGHVEFHFGIVVPGVAALLARRAELELGLLVRRAARVVVRRCEQDLPGSRPEKRAGGLALPRRNAPRVPGFEVELVDLVERIARLALALEHELLPVRREIALSRSLALEGQLP